MICGRRIESKPQHPGNQMKASRRVRIGRPYAAKIFFSDGWWSLTRPLSSHLTTASSSLARSTVPNTPFGFPKSPKPSTRSPGISSWLVAGGSESGGLLARCESGIAPACDRGGSGALRSLGIGFLMPWFIAFSSPRGRSTGLLQAGHRLERYLIDMKIGVKGIDKRSKQLSSHN